MMRYCILAIGLMSWFGSAFAAAPHIGYIYPAGGEKGAVLKAEMGGQHLEKITRIHLDGVQVHILKYAVKYDVKRVRQIARGKKNAEQQLEAERKKPIEKQDKKKILKLERRVKKLAHDLSVADFPEGFDVNDKKSIRKYFKKDKKNQFNPQLADRLYLELEIDSDALPGVRELRVETDKGLSNPIFFEIGELKEYREKEPNDDHQAPVLQTVSTPCIMNGQIMPGDIDHFRFKAKKGQNIVVKVSARRIIPYLADAVPGWFQAVVALYDEEGNEVAYQDDYTFHPDPVLFFNVPHTATYTLSIKDSIYRGREDFVYRIDLGELPFITSVFPLGGEENSEVSIDLLGWNLPTNKIVGRVFEEAGTVRHLSVKKDGYQSNPMPFLIGNLPEILESESNNTDQTAQKVSLPQVVNGRIQTSNDIDYFSFQGEKGSTVSIKINARVLGSPLDAMIELSGPGLKTPVRNDDYMLEDSAHLHLGAGLLTHYADPYLLQTLPATGTYLVKVSDTQGKGGKEFAYRLRIAPANPNYTLRLEPSGQQIEPGATALFSVRALRSEGFKGTIHLSVTNLPLGFMVKGTEMTSNATLTQLTLTAPRKMKSQIVSPLVIGTAIENEKEIRRVAVPVDDQMQAFLYRHLVPAKQLVLYSSEKPAAFVFKLKPNHLESVPILFGKETRIIFLGRRNRRFKGAKLELDHPPKGIKVIKGWIGPRRIKGKTKKGKPRLSKNELWGQIIIKAEAPLKVGDTATLVVVGTIKKGKNNIERHPSPAFKIQIVNPQKKEEKKRVPKH